MQMNALRSANFAKLSSNSSTSDEYWVTSMSDGTPAGYCLSQIRSMVFPSLFICYFPSLLGRDRLVFGSIGNAAQDGKRLRVIDALATKLPTRLTGQKPLKSPAEPAFSWPASTHSWVLRRPWAWPVSARGLRWRLQAFRPVLPRHAGPRVLRRLAWLQAWPPALLPAWPRPRRPAFSPRPATSFPVAGAAYWRRGQPPRSGRRRVSSGPCRPPTAP